MANRLRQLISKVFQLEEINGAERCPTYLYRWTLLRIRGYAIYLHHFVGDDWARDMHDHPKSFISIGLQGRYIEETPAPLHNAEKCGCGNRARWCPYNPQATEVVPIVSKVRQRMYIAPWIRTFRAEHIHRLRLIDGKDCWTLVIVLKTVRQWGFWTNNASNWIPWRRYVGDDTIARKNCP